MKPYDVIIVGSGPAGVSAAFPLVEAGLKVLMVDGGELPVENYPQQSFLQSRKLDRQQSDWMLGKDFYALKNSDAVSPKLRVPTYVNVFKDFCARNRIETTNFNALGSLAIGGLSNAWGCGVASLDSSEMQAYPFSLEELAPSYKRVGRRIGISGRNEDDMSAFFGVDNVADEPIAADFLQDYIHNKYLVKRKTSPSVKFGRTRVAVLSQSRDGRTRCEEKGNCLWGCKNNALYSALQDLARLRLFSNFSHLPGFIVQDVRKDGDYFNIISDTQSIELSARKIILAAGTLATTRLAMKLLKLRSGLQILSCPTAAFMLWLPRFLGASCKDSFGLGQYSYTFSIGDGGRTFGSLFSTNGIARSEFIRYMPMPKRYAIDFLRNLMTSCVVGNLFLPGALSKSQCTLHKDGSLTINGVHDSIVKKYMVDSKVILRHFFANLGAYMLPASFKTSAPGSCIHYAASLPMTNNPVIGQTSQWGELKGYPGIYIADGASLCDLPAKSHTLTIMANADRIGTHLANHLINKSF